MKENIKRFITCNVPVTACNFKCDYCYLRNCGNPAIKDLCLPPKELAERLSVERLGGICYFNLCADGETLMQPQLIQFVKELTKRGHYVDIITNGTLSNKFDELIDTLNEKEQGHLFIKFSFHYIELMKHNLLDVYVNNVNKVKNSNISYTIEITPYDDLIPYISEIKSFSLKNFGALPHITVARDSDTEKIEILTSLSKDEYKKVWGQFDSELFNFKFSTFNVKQTSFCYAGDWSLMVYLGTGEYKQCYKSPIKGNIMNDKEIDFCAIGKCTLPHCFNSHAFLAFGCIPGEDKTTYSLERDRVTVDNKHWLKENFREFFATKLYNANEEYTEKKKKESLQKTNLYLLEDYPKKTLYKLKRIINGKKQ